VARVLKLKRREGRITQCEGRALRARVFSVGGELHFSLTGPMLINGAHDRGATGPERCSDQFKLLVLLGDFRYYQGRPMRPSKCWTVHRGPQAEEEPMVFFQYGVGVVLRGERDRIDSRIFRYKPEELVDGDLAEWIGVVYALLGETGPALAWLRQAVRVRNQNFPRFQRDQELGQAARRR
jgi:hypothetical protein